MERIALKQFGFGGRFSLNWSGQFLEEPVECRGGRDLDHYFLVNQLIQGFSFGHPPGAMIPLGGVQRLQKLIFVKANGIAKGLETLLGNFDADAAFGLLGDLCVKRPQHGKRVLEEQGKVNATGSFSRVSE